MSSPSSHRPVETPAVLPLVAPQSPGRRRFTTRSTRGLGLHAGSLGLLLAACVSGCGGPAPTEDVNVRNEALSAAPDPSKTVTVHVHGWNLSGATKTGTVGDDRGGGDAVDGIIRFSGLPHGRSNPTAKNQIVATEYYGSTLPSYYSAADRAQVMALKGIPRYAAIVGKYARQVLARSGADGVNLTCHSMGCLISRYLIENDVEHLASDGKIRRWVSFAGVVGGAKLADLDKGRWLDAWARLLGLDLIDVEHMSHDWVEKNVAVYDHKRRDGNNPVWGGMLVHHITSTNPKIDRALSMPLLDLFGFGGAPNDGIVLVDEMQLHEQQASAQWKTPMGTLLPVSHSDHFADHFTINDQASAHAIAAAGLVGSRRVRVSLASVTLLRDKEHLLFDTAPAEVVVETKVRYPYVAAIDPTNPLITETTMDRRVAPVFQMRQGETKAPGLMLFEGPVFDAQTSIALDIHLAETDFYPAAKINENALSKPETLGRLTQEVPLANGDYTVTTGDARFTVHVAVEALY